MYFLYVFVPKLFWYKKVDVFCDNILKQNMLFYACVVSRYSKFDGLFKTVCFAICDTTVSCSLNIKFELGMEQNPGNGEDLMTLEAEISELQRENARVESQMLKLKSDINAMESHLSQGEKVSNCYSHHSFIQSIIRRFTFHYNVHYYQNTLNNASKDVTTNTT